MFVYYNFVCDCIYKFFCEKLCCMINQKQYRYNQVWANNGLISKSSKSSYSKIFWNLRITKIVSVSFCICFVGVLQSSLYYVVLTLDGSENLSHWLGFDCFNLWKIMTTWACFLGSRLKLIFHWKTQLLIFEAMIQIVDEFTLRITRIKMCYLQKALDLMKNHYQKLFV